MINRQPQLIAAILSGGHCRRFGSDKAMAPVPGTGKPVLLHLRDVLSICGFSPVVSVDRSGRYPDCGMREIPDLLADRGPVGGLQALLHATDADAVLVASCDMPRVTVEMIENLVQAFDDGHDACIFSAGKWQPFPGIYSRSILPRVTQELKRASVGMMTLLQGMEDRLRILPCAEPQNFFNMNTPEAHRELLGAEEAL